MTAEERKTIEKLKGYKELFLKGYCKDCNELCVIDNFPSKDLENNIDIILNLIEKLQKENSELQEKIENLKMKLSIYDSENRKLKHIVMSLPNGLEILEIIRK